MLVWLTTFLCSLWGGHEFIKQGKGLECINCQMRTPGFQIGRRGPGGKLE